MVKINSLEGTKTLNGHPDECPYCNRKITPENIFSNYNNLTGQLDAFQKCPNKECQKTFISYYHHMGGTNFAYANKTTQGFLRGKDFSETINGVSSSFTLIYNQAYSAEQQNLNEICGVGYRKALEYLIKDYLISNYPEDIIKIQNKLLGQCISELIQDSRIKSVAKRATWLGNDETHYIKKWEGKNLQDLKKLIDLTVHWIEMEMLTKSFEDEMPD